MYSLAEISSSANRGLSPFGGCPTIPLSRPQVHGTSTVSCFQIMRIIETQMKWTNDSEGIRSRRRQHNSTILHSKLTRRRVARPGPVPLFVCWALWKGFRAMPVGRKRSNRGRAQCARVADSYAATAHSFPCFAVEQRSNLLSI